MKGEQADEFFAQPTTKAALLTHAILRHGDQIIDFDSHYRRVVRDESLAGRQKNWTEYNSLIRLRQLLTKGYVTSLLALWDFGRDADALESIPAYLSRMERLAFKGKLRVPLATRDQEFAHASCRLARAIEKVKHSNSYRRLKNFRDKEIAHRLSETRFERTSGPIEDPKHANIDIIFVWTVWSMREISTQFFAGENHVNYREAVDRSRQQTISMWKNINRSIAKEMRQPTSSGQKT